MSAFPYIWANINHSVAIGNPFFAYEHKKNMSE